MSASIRQTLMLAATLVILVTTCDSLRPAVVYGQLNNGGNNNVGNNAGGNNAGGNNRGAGGILINPQGVVSLAVTTDVSGALDRKRRSAVAQKTLNGDLNVASKTRFVSLVELERTVAHCVDQQQPIPDDIFYLAGLQQIEEILVLPESNDLLIAGPAEGFAPDSVGRMIGVVSGRPVLRLDDLAVALRTLAHSREVGCSIDPDPNRLADLQKFIKQGVAATPDVVEARFRQMDQILGLQNVRVDGVPAESHFSVAMVEADYRMKLISIGLENPGVKGLKSHLAMVGAGGNAMQRWWFVPLYDGILRSPDGLAYRFAGPRAQLLSEEELADAQGNRFAAPTTRASTKAFAKQFTDKFPELAARSAIFGELQNLIDWAVFAALLQRERLADRVDWKMATLLDERRLVVPTFNAPKQVPSVVNFKRAGGQIVGLVGGGVIVETGHVLNQITTPASDPRLETARALAASSTRKDAHRWWWDAEETTTRKPSRGK